MNWIAAYESCNNSHHNATSVSSGLTNQTKTHNYLDMYLSVRQNWAYTTCALNSQVWPTDSVTIDGWTFKAVEYVSVFARVSDNSTRLCWWGIGHSMIHYRYRVTSSSWKSQLQKFCNKNQAPRKCHIFLWNAYIAHSMLLIHSTRFIKRLFHNALHLLLRIHI